MDDTSVGTVPYNIIQEALKSIPELFKIEETDHLAALLDIRQKKYLSKKYLKEREPLNLKLLEKYVTKVKDTLIIEEKSSQESTSSQSQLLKGFFRSQDSSSSETNVETDSCKEIQSFLSNEDISASSLLGWWNLNWNRYKIVSKVTRDIALQPLTSLPHNYWQTEYFNNCIRIANLDDDFFNDEIFLHYNSKYLQF